MATGWNTLGKVRLGYVRKGCQNVTANVVVVLHYIFPCTISLYIFFPHSVIFLEKKVILISMTLVNALQLRKTLIINIFFRTLFSFNFLNKD